MKADNDLELHLYYRVRRTYTDVLRAKKRDVPDDSEESSSESDNDEDQLDKIARRDRRRDRRYHTAKRVQRLISQGDLPENCEDVDDIQAWMDDQGHILNVSSMLPCFLRTVDLCSRNREVSADMC